MDRSRLRRMTCAVVVAACVGLSVFGAPLYGAPSAAGDPFGELGVTRMSGDVPAVAFDLKALDGAPLDSQHLAGKVVVLNFWATWCGPCNIEAPILDQVGKKYDDKGLVVVGVSQDSDPGLPRAWTHQKKITYPMVFDDSNGASRFDVDGLPTMVVLDRQGVVRAVRVGVTQKSELEDLVEKYL